VPSWLEGSLLEILRRNLSIGPRAACQILWLCPTGHRPDRIGTFGNRFDDPDATYRVLNVSSQLGCFVETLARFRIDPRLVAELAAIEGGDDQVPPGEVPLEWIGKRMMGVATVDAIRE
jgi:hypothetical protein